jgi:hypothetical protein
MLTSPTCSCKRKVDIPQISGQARSMVTAVNTVQSFRVFMLATTTTEVKDNGAQLHAHRQTTLIANVAMILLLAVGQDAHCPCH